MGRLDSKGALEAKLFFVTEPSAEQRAGIEAYLRKRYNREDVALALVEDDSLGSGFVLRVGNEIIDWSTKGRISQLEEHLEEIKKGIVVGEDGEVRICSAKTPDYMEKAASGGILSILKTEIGDFHLEAMDKEVGQVSWVGDGIANVVGINHARFGDLVLFESGVKGLVQDIRKEDIGCILFGRDTQIREGSRVISTGKRAGTPVGEAFLGRVINALGEPVDGGDPIVSEGYRALEEPAPSIVDRKSVNTPLETGILAIDSMFPIGRGQRELIIGDRQTGKTSLALDAMLNQKGKDVVCIYVAIGQKASTVAQLVGILRQHQAMEYTIVVTATASEPAPMQYAAPYTGTALAEFFMHQGRDVLIIYDDLSKHAVAYRALSLLLERPPGREAYPGDVFYLHSRLLERSARMRDDLGGGSITALPIIETQAGDVSAYIPTNVISITDGQIFLESELFFSGQRPAVNVGLSVSRVGGAAQTKAMKKASGTIRIDLAQFREMEVFTQFASDLDPSTKRLLDHGRVLMELLRQPLARPLSMPEQVICLCVANAGLLDDLPASRIKEFQMAMLEHFGEHHAEVETQLRTSEDLDEILVNEICKIANGFKQGFY